MRKAVKLAIACIAIIVLIAVFYTAINLIVNYAVSNYPEAVEQFFKLFKSFFGKGEPPSLTQEMIDRYSNSTLGGSGG